MIWLHWQQQTSATQFMAKCWGWSWKLQMEREDAHSPQQVGRLSEVKSPDICPRQELWRRRRRRRQQELELSILRNNNLLRANVEENARAGRQIRSIVFALGVFNVNKWNRNKYLTRIVARCPRCEYVCVCESMSLCVRVCVEQPQHLAPLPSLRAPLPLATCKLFRNALLSTCRVSLRRVDCCSSLFLAVAYLSQQQQQRQLKALACYTLWNQLQPTAPALPTTYPYYVPACSQVFMFVLGGDS